MALQSRAFAGDPKLEAAAVSDSDHLTQGAAGDYVRKIQHALIKLDGASIAADGAFGPATARAVVAYKTKRNIVNQAYQKQPDSIVGMMTIVRLDKEMSEWKQGHRTESVDKLNAEIDVLLLRMCVYPGGIREANEIRHLRDSVTAPKSPQYVGDEIGADPVTLALFALIFTLITFAAIAQGNGMRQETDLLGRELSRGITRFNHLLWQMSTSWPEKFLRTIAEIDRIITRAQNNIDSSVAECQRNAPDPNRWKQCLDQKTKVKQAQASLERFRQMLRSPERGKKYDENWANGELNRYAKEILDAMKNYKSCMGCP